MSKVVRLKQVGKKYAVRYALRNVSFDLEPGELVYVTGVSGAGKSTLLKLLYGMELASEGSIQMGSWQLEKLNKKRLPEYRKQVGFIFQDFKLLPELTIAENVRLPLDIQKMNTSQAMNRVMGVLKLVGLDDRAMEFPGNLSGGEQQRVAIARSIVGRPSLLLADEPTGNLDTRNSREVMQLFREIREMGTTVVIATHDELLMDMFPSRKIELDSGTIVSDSGRL